MSPGTRLAFAMHGGHVTFFTATIYIQVASARFAGFSYCGCGFARFTLYGNPVCTIEVVGRLAVVEALWRRTGITGIIKHK